MEYEYEIVRKFAIIELLNTKIMDEARGGKL